MNSRQRRVARRRKNRDAEPFGLLVFDEAHSIPMTPAERRRYIDAALVHTKTSQEILADIQAFCNVQIPVLPLTERSKVVSDLLIYGNSQHIENEDGSITHVPLKLPE